MHQGRVVGGEERWATSGGKGGVTKKGGEEERRVHIKRHMSTCGHICDMEFITKKCIGW